MTTRKLTILAALAAVMLIITLALYSGGKKQPNTFTSGSLLIQGLDPERVHTIKIKSGDTEVDLQREGDQFVVASKDNYPAKTQSVNDLLIACLEVRCASRITKSAENHKELGVNEDDADAVVVKFIDSKGDTITGIVRGKSQEGGRGQYVRRLGDDEVYLSENYFNVNSTEQNYLDSMLTSVDAEKVTSVAVKTPDSSYTIKRNDDGEIVLQDIPAGKQTKGRTYESVFRAATNLRFNEVEPADNIDVEFADAFTMTLDSGLVYTIRVGKKDDKSWIALSAKAPDVGNRITIDRDESKEELEKKEARVMAAETAQKFNERHKSWVYNIADWYAGNLTKPLDELIENIPATDDLESKLEGDESPAIRQIPGPVMPAVQP